MPAQEEPTSGKEALTPYDVSVIRDLVLWVQDQDSDARQQGDDEFLLFLDDEHSQDHVRLALDRILEAAENWF